MSKIGALALLLLAVSAAAATGTANFNSTLGGTPGQYQMPYDTGLPGPPPTPPTFAPPQTFQPAGGGPPVQLGDDEVPIIAVSDGGMIHHFTIFRHPTISNLTIITLHEDTNGNGVYDAGEAVHQSTVAN